MEPAQSDVKPTKKSSKASRFVAKLSPKKFQRKREVTKIATMKVKDKYNCHDKFKINFKTLYRLRYIPTNLKLNQSLMDFESGYYRSICIGVKKPAMMLKTKLV